MYGVARRWGMAVTVVLVTNSYSPMATKAAERMLGSRMVQSEAGFQFVHSVDELLCVIRKATAALSDCLSLLSGCDAVTLHC